MVDIEMKKAA
jgi:hypothetical protein